MAKNKKKQHSITTQITLTIVGLVAGTVLLCWLLNVTLLEGYYTRYKQEVLENGFQQINAASEQGILNTSDYDIDFEKICSNGNLTILIITSDGTVVRSSTNGVENLRMQFMEIIMASVQNDDMHLNMKVLKANDNYVMGEKEDTRLESDYLILWGTLADGNLLLARTPLESIKESAQVSNRLLMDVGVVAVIVSGIIIFFVTRRITNPILRLTDISKKMAEFDFDAKYEVKGDNEIEQLGEHMNQLSEILERTISELKSANNELKIDIEKKEQIDEMRKDFLSNVSHELKTPLALIQGYAEGLQECVQDDPESRNFYCEVITDEAEKMNRMVKKLLTLNQLEFGNDAIVMERFDITELIRGVTASNAIILEQKGAILEFDEQPLFVWADEFKIEEVITNYLSNAINHLEGENRIKISYECKQDVVRVSVFNTGKPIPEEDIDNIWIKFYKVDKARTRAYGGSGIGLSIVKAIMDSMHQQCGVINHEDGVEFWIELDTSNRDDNGEECEITIA